MRGRTTGGLSVELEGIFETLSAVRGLQADLRNTVNGELRQAADSSARELVVELRASASSSGVPVAPRVARSARVVRDRVPVVSIGGPMRVGDHDGSAGELVWGSEQGPKGDVNHFAVAPSSGYWIAPAVRRYSERALANFQRAVYEILHRRGLA